MKALPAMTVAALALLSAYAFAASPEPPGGAAACTGCHAVNPAAETPVPKINGQKAEELFAAMVAFRTGAKPSTVMGRIAKGYTDEEMRPITNWLATQK
jgi:cytochrome c553